MYKKIFLLFFLFAAGFFIFNTVHSSIDSSTNTGFVFECRGCDDNGWYAATLPDYQNFQAWKGTFVASVEGHGSGARYGVDMCLSFSGAMYQPGEPCWQIVDRNTGGVINDGHGTVNAVAGTRDIGNDPAPNLATAVVNLYADDVTFEYMGSTGSTAITVYGRQVSMSGPSASPSSVNVGGGFTVSWSSAEAVPDADAVEIIYSGPVSCNYPSPSYFGGNSGGSISCTGTGAGTATFDVSVRGYGGRNNSRPKTISNSVNVNIASAAGGVTFNVTDGCSGGNIAGNATITLSGIGTQVTSSAGSYNTTTFGSVPNGSYSWSSSVPGYNNTSGTVNVSGSGSVNFAQPRTCGGPPTLTLGGATISSVSVIADSATPYTITTSATDSSGGANIMQEYALINLQGENAGLYRGYLTWGSTDWWPTSKNHMACSGGGWAVVQNQAPNNIYGHGYINLTSCSTVVSGNSRTVHFNVTFDPSYNTAGPLTNNDISMYAADTSSVTAGWTNYQTNFNIVQIPYVNNVTISAPQIRNDNTTQYTISLTGTEATGGANITHEFALINYDGNSNGTGGHTPADYRGYVTWYFDGAYTGWDAYKDKKSCAGGGVAAIQPGYGETFLRLDSCSTSVAGNTRTTNFVVRFDPSFTNPISNNDISGWVATWPNYPSWALFNTDFTVVPPSIDTVTISSSTINPNGSTQYTISETASDFAGGSNVAQEYALINLGGSNAGQYRGYLTWSSTDWWPSDKNHTVCAGGGWAVIQSVTNPGYGDQHINLVSCSTTVSGNSRTVNYTVTFNPSFVAPVSGNDIAGITVNAQSNFPAWRNFTTGFSLVGAIIPNAPTITGTATYINTSYPFTFNATDPGGNQIRYGIDWDMDGTADEWLPSSGYVNSGTNQSTNHSWSSAGSQTFQALTQNTLGNNSSWTQKTVNPANLPVNGACGSGATSYASGDTSYSGPYCASGTAFGCSSGSDPNCAFPAQGASVTWQCSGQFSGSPSGTCTASRSNSTVNVNVNVVTAGGVVNGPGIVNCTGSCSTSVVLNSSITLTATPASSYWQFNGWGLDCSFAGKSKTCTFTANSNKDVQATFVPRIFNYSEF